MSSLTESCCLPLSYSTMHCTASVNINECGCILILDITQGKAIQEYIAPIKDLEYWELGNIALKISSLTQIVLVI